MPDGDSDIEISPGTGSKQPPSEPQSGGPCVFWVRDFLPAGTRSGLVGKVSSSCWECRGPEEFPSQREWDSGLHMSPESATQRGRGWERGKQAGLCLASFLVACAFLWPCWLLFSMRSLMLVPWGREDDEEGPALRAQPKIREFACRQGGCFLRWPPGEHLPCKTPTGSWASLSPCHPCT